MAIRTDDPFLDDEELLFVEPMRRLTADMRKAAETMSDAEVRYLIDLYYSNHEMRKAGDNKLRASRADGEPNSFTQFLAAQVEALEGACNGALQVVARRTRTGRWCMAIKGISGVLTAGLSPQYPAAGRAQRGTKRARGHARRRHAAPGVSPHRHGGAAAHLR
jgi:hypothetical protein